MTEEESKKEIRGQPVSIKRESSMWRIGEVWQRDSTDTCSVSVSHYLKVTTGKIDIVFIINKNIFV